MPETEKLLDLFARRALPAASISWIENYSTKLLGDSLPSLLKGNAQVLQAPSRYRATSNNPRH